MIEKADQIFILLRDWLVGFLPAAGKRPLAVAAGRDRELSRCFRALFALTTVLERKGLGRMQNRLGPNRVGPFGILQPSPMGSNR